MPFIEAALDADEFMNHAEPYKVNGGVTGRKSFDDAEFTRKIITFDDDRGSSISKVLVSANDPDDVRKNGYTFAEVADKVNVAMRRRYMLDKKGKVTGVNTKRYRLLGQSK
jgi:hypothetical protein